MLGDSPYRQDISRCLGATGLDRAGFDAVLARTGTGLGALRRAHGDGSLPLLRLPANRDDIAMIEARAEHHRGHADAVVVLGTGGSSLGGQALYALADSGFGPSGDSPRLHFLDNIDPHTFDHLFRTVDLARTDFVAVSKSGGTAETLTQLLICLEALADSVGREAARDHVTVITEPADNPLRGIAERWGFTVLDHDPGIGGRFSALTPVGLLPATIAGLDPAAVREGAQGVLYRCLHAEEPGTCPPALGAALNVAFDRTTVMMPYADRLVPFAMWFRQLWAESLGKDGKGTLPVRASGAVDQHSQLQLYLDGPADKLFTIVASGTEGRGRTVPGALAGDGRTDYLSGHSMGDLFAAEALATIDTLAGRNLPVRVLRLERVDEAAMGALMMHFMLETILAAGLLGVDAFDQPAVEEGKRLAREYLAAMRARDE